MDLFRFKAPTIAQWSPSLHYMDMSAEVNIGRGHRTLYVSNNHDFLRERRAPLLYKLYRLLSRYHTERNGERARGSETKKHWAFQGRQDSRYRYTERDSETIDQYGCTGNGTEVHKTNVDLCRGGHTTAKFKERVLNHEYGDPLGIGHKEQRSKFAACTSLDNPIVCEGVEVDCNNGYRSKGASEDLGSQYTFPYSPLRWLHNWQKLVLVLLLFFISQGAMASDVTLSSSLGERAFAEPGEHVVFSCTTRRSLVLEWFSNEYIGTGGDGISLLSVNCLNSNVTSDVYPSTQATCIDVTAENGVTVIQSMLWIIATLERPYATITCTNNGLGSNGSISFQTLEPVVLTSTLDEGSVPYPGTEIIFTCITRGSLVLEWFSNEYIGTGGDGISLLSVNCLNSNVTSDVYPSTRATCVSITTENDVTVIESRLYITVSAMQQTATVTCTNNGLGSRAPKTFDTAVQSFNGTTHVMPGVTTVAQTTQQSHGTDDGNNLPVIIAVVLTVAGLLVTFVISITLIGIIIVIASKKDKIPQQRITEKVADLEVNSSSSSTSSSASVTAGHEVLHVAED